MVGNHPDVADSHLPDRHHYYIVADNRLYEDAAGNRPDAADNHPGEADSLPDVADYHSVKLFQILQDGIRLLLFFLFLMSMFSVHEYVGAEVYLLRDNLSDSLLACSPHGYCHSAEQKSLVTCFPFLNP